eukprot:scaffold582_cov385-Prasinococcus_capsulatus_cf.AAC.5
MGRHEGGCPTDAPSKCPKRRAPATVRCAATDDVLVDGICGQGELTHAMTHRRLEACSPVTRKHPHA